MLLHDPTLAAMADGITINVGASGTPYYVIPDAR